MSRGRSFVLLATKLEGGVVKVRVLLLVCLASLLSALVCATGIIVNSGGPDATGIIVAKRGHEAAGGRPRPPHWF
jgi:hypothetical protein